MAYSYILFLLNYGFKLRRYLEMMNKRARRNIQRALIITPYPLLLVQDDGEDEIGVPRGDPETFGAVVVTVGTRAV